jgi:hypothetical protein
MGRNSFAQLSTHSLPVNNCGLTNFWCSARRILLGIVMTIVIASRPGRFKLFDTVILNAIRNHVLDPLRQEPLSPGNSVAWKDRSAST